MAVTQTRTGSGPETGDLPASQVGKGRSPGRKPAPVNIEEEVEPFWDWLKQFTADDWGYRVIVYPWRCSPMVDLSANGKNTSLGKLARPFDMDSILKEFGSGHYRFDVCAIDPTGNKQSRIRQHYEMIMHPDYPPRVPLGAWINAPENEMWKWAEEPLKLEQAQRQARIKSIEDGPSAGTIANPSDIFKTVLAGIQTLRGEKDDNAGLASQLVTMLMKDRESMAKLNDPIQQLSTLKTLMDGLRPEKPSNDGMMVMVDFLKDTVSALREEIKEMRTGQSKQTFSEQLREFTTVFTEVAPSLGFSKRGTPGVQNNPPNETEQVVSTIGNVITQVLEKGAVYVPLLQQAMARGNGPPPPQPGWTPPATQIPAAPVNPPQQPTPAPQETIDMSTMTPEQRDAVKALDAKMQACWVKHQALITQLVPFVVDRFKAKETGYEFRDWFLDRYGRFVWSQFRDDSGPEVLTTLSGLHPYLKTVLGPPDLVLQYFQEFFTEQGQEPEESVVPDSDEDNGDDDAA